MKVGLLFAGQGAQHAGMGKDLYEALPRFRELFDSLADQVDFDLKTLCFEGPEEQLSRTAYTQPCMVAFAAALSKVLLEEGVEPVAAAGLSLGEYSALCASGVFTPAQAVKLAAFRGQAMTRAAQGLDCGMAAVLGLDREKLAAACAQAAQGEVVEIANYNCPGQMSIAGTSAAVDRACALAKEAGARRCVPLKVSGPFHTSLMAPAGEELARRLAGEPLGEMKFPVYFNCLGAPMGAGDTVPALLEKQVQSSVYMEDTLRRMAEDGVEAFLEIGPGKVLSGFVKKTVGLPVKSVETLEELNQALAWVKGEA